MKQIIVSLVLLSLTLASCTKTNADIPTEEAILGTTRAEVLDTMGGTEETVLKNSLSEQVSTEATSYSNIVLKNTAQIMASFSIDEMEVVVGYDEDFNIFVNFAPFNEDRRIPVKSSSESEIEWFDYPGDENSSRINLEMFTVKDSFTDKDYYILRLFYAGTPHDKNLLYLFNAQQSFLVDSISSIDALSINGNKIITTQLEYVDDSSLESSPLVEVIYEIQDGVFKLLENNKN